MAGLRIADASDPGRARRHNEDAILRDDKEGIFAVVDGVGGAVGGATAARIATEVLHGRLLRRTGDIERRLREAITLANNQIFETAEADQKLHGMACVLTVAVIEQEAGEPNRVTVGHVGDSRLYLLRPGCIEQQTDDHSPVGRLEAVGELNEQQAMAHPRRNEIYRDVGSALHRPNDEDFIDILSLSFADDEALLLCTDGLTDMLISQDILTTVENHCATPAAAVEELIRQANEAGGKDNITALLVLGASFGLVRHNVAPEVRSDISQSPEPSQTSEPQSESLARQPKSVAKPKKNPETALEVGHSARARGLGERIGGRVRQRRWLIASLVVLALGGLFHNRVVGFLQAGWAELKWPEWQTLVVGPAQEFASINAAIAAARPGETIEVWPGTYNERVRLTNGVRIKSLQPRQAVLALADQGTTDYAVAVEAIGVTDAEFVGFRIEGSNEFPLEVGLRLENSQVLIDDLEISGARVAGIEIAGSDRSEIRYSTVQGNLGIGILITGNAMPRILHTLVLANGVGASPLPGVEVRDRARPRLIGNYFSNNGGESNQAINLLVPSGLDADSLLSGNHFVPDGRVVVSQGDGNSVDGDRP